MAGTSTAPDAAKAHANGFDYLRLFACLLVTFGHAYALTGQVGPAFAAIGVQTMGLKIFFVLSGYLVSVSWLSDPNVPRFLMRRCLRILPALFVVVALSALIAGPILSTLSVREYFTHPVTWLYFSNAAMNIRYSLPGVFSTNVYPHAVNGSLWSLPVEFVMYIVGPGLIILLGAAKSRLGALAYVVLSVLITILSLLVMRVWPVPPPLVIYGTNVWYILEMAPFFLIGSAFAVMRLEHTLNLGLALAAFLALALFPIPVIALQEAALILVLTYSCLALGRSAIPGLGKVAHFGDLSYGTFLYSFPVQQTLVHVIGVRGGPWANFFLGSVIAAALAFASWHLVERPALALKPGRPDKGALN